MEELYNLRFKLYDFFKDLKVFDKVEVFIQVSKLEVKIKDLKDVFI